MKKFLNFIVIALCACAAIALAAKPDVFVSSALNGIKLWAVIVLPALLPFFFLTALASALGLTRATAKLAGKPFSKIFRTSGVCAYAFVTSVLSGYPVGAKIISDLKTQGLISTDEATRAATFCSTSGPLFIVGSVGYGMFSSKNAGFKIFICHVLSAVICGLVFRFYGKREISDNRLISPLNNADNILYDCVYSSVVSVAVVGGFICVFYLFADTLEYFGVIAFLAKPLAAIIKNERIANAVAGGAIECTRGCKLLSLCGTNKITVSLACGLVSFGGVSVIVQSIAFLQKAKVKIAVFLSSKIIQTIIAFTLCLLLY